MQLNRLHKKDIGCSQVPRMKRHRIKGAVWKILPPDEVILPTKQAAACHRLLTAAAITRSAQLAMQLAVRTGSLAS